MTGRPPDPIVAGSGPNRLAAAVHGFSVAFAVSASLFGLGALVAILLLPSRRRLQELRDAAAADDAALALSPALAHDAAVALSPALADAMAASSADARR